MAAGDRLNYDHELGVCNWPWMVDCNITTTESPTTTTIVTEPSETSTNEPVSTTESRINGTTIEPTSDATTAIKPITSEKPKTSKLPEDPSTTSKATSSGP